MTATHTTCDLCKAWIDFSQARIYTGDPFIMSPCYVICIKCAANLYISLKTLDSIMRSASKKAV